MGYYQPEPSTVSADGYWYYSCPNNPADMSEGEHQGTSACPLATIPEGTWGESETAMHRPCDFGNDCR